MRNATATTSSTATTLGSVLPKTSSRSLTRLRLLMVLCVQLLYTVEHCDDDDDDRDLSTAPQTRTTAAPTFLSFVTQCDHRLRTTSPQTLRGRVRGLNHYSTYRRCALRRTIEAPNRTRRGRQGGGRTQNFPRATFCPARGMPVQGMCGAF